MSEECEYPVRCRKCGITYDYDEHETICPKCGHDNASDEEPLIGIAINTEEKYEALMKLLGLPSVKPKSVS